MCLWSQQVSYYLPWLPGKKNTISGFAHSMMNPFLSPREWTCSEERFFASSDTITSPWRKRSGRTNVPSWEIAYLSELTELSNPSAQAKYPSASHPTLRGPSNNTKRKRIDDMESNSWHYLLSYNKISRSDFQSLFGIQNKCWRFGYIALWLKYLLLVTSCMLHDASCMLQVTGDANYAHSRLRINNIKSQS